jgi:phosphohistidine phosphatase
MKLLLMRHAKASPGDGVDDHERPLAPRGTGDATTVGRWLADRVEHLDAVWCSTALRARQTWEGVAAELGDAPEATYLRAVYEATPTDLLDLFRAAPREVQTLLVVGHNPTIQELVQVLIGRPRDFPTGAVAIIEVDGGWSQPAARLTDFGAPKTV